MRAPVLLALLGASCFYDLDAVPRPGDGGGADASGDAGPLSIFTTAASPEVVGPGDTVVVEGRFSGDFVVFLPGLSGSVQPAAERLGSRRVAVTIPPSAVSGPVEFRSGDVTIPGPALRVTAFPPRLGDFAVIPRQFGIGRQAAALATPRRAFTAVVIGDWLYAIGGVSGTTTWLADVERARVDADGALGPFEGAGSLGESRALAAHVVTGERLYVIGGVGEAGLSGTVERAAVGGAGLGPFEPVSSTLVHPRASHTATIIGDAVYIVGGEDEGGAVGTIERAPIDENGLGPFEEVAGASVLTPRRALASLVTRARLYLTAGGDGVGAALDDVERAPVSGEGAVGAFEVDPAIDVQPRQGQAGLLAGHRAVLVGGAEMPAVEEAALDASGALADFVTTTASLRVNRAFAGLAVHREHAYLAGGLDTADLASVEEASLASGATIGAFEAAGALTTPRAHAVLVALGSSLCAIGGDSTAEAGGELASVECAPVAADGSLGAFASTGMTLATPRRGACAATIGGSLYVIGGDDGSGPLDTIERAPIAADGALGAFTIDAVALVTPRDGAGAIVIGDSLHVLGGWTGTAFADDEDVAATMADGSLSAFAAGGAMVPRVQGPRYGVHRDWVFLIGPGENKKATISGETLADFAGAGGQALGNDIAVAVGGDLLYATGGAPGDPSKVYAWRLAASGLTNAGEAGTLITPRSAASAVVLGEWLYVVGGLSADGATVLDGIERARLR